MEDKSKTNTRLGVSAFWVLWCGILPSVICRPNTYVIATMLIPAIAVIPVLAEKMILPMRHMVPVLLVSFATIVAALLIYDQRVFHEVSLSRLFVPVFQLMLVGIAYAFFVRKMGKPPVDTIFVFSGGLGADRLYAISMMFFVWAIPAIWIS